MQQEIIDKLNSKLPEFIVEVPKEDQKEFEESLRQFGYYAETRFFERSSIYYKIVKKKCKI